ncbi:predicted protein [Streptomyces sp. SPB78]|nr:predicted protein [Streptomyces sp. SPB78]
MAGLLAGGGEETAVLVGADEDPGLGAQPGPQRGERRLAVRAREQRGLAGVAAQPVRTGEDRREDGVRDRVHERPRVEGEERPGREPRREGGEERPGGGQRERVAGEDHEVVGAQGGGDPRGVPGVEQVLDAEAGHEAALAGLDERDGEAGVRAGVRGQDRRDVLAVERRADEVAVGAGAVRARVEGGGAEAAGGDEGVEAAARGEAAAGGDDVAAALGEGGHVEDEVGDDIAEQDEAAAHRSTSWRLAVRSPGSSSAGSSGVRGPFGAPSA